MDILYPIEEHWYTYEDIKAFTGNLESLQSSNIVKKKDNLYKFVYVGVIVDKSENSTSIIIVLPKYLDSVIMTEDEKKNYANLLVQIFRKYAKDSLNNENLDDLDYLSEDTQFSLFAVIDYLINDYLQYGLYSNNLEAHEYNGNGLIDWRKTISEEYVLITNRQAIYTDFHTSVDENDENDYIRLLHKNIIYKCFEFLQEISFLDFFEYPSLYISQAKSLIQDIDYQVRAIEIEMRNVFSDRKIHLLKAMKYFLKEQSTLNPNDMILYGTSSFYYVWEDAVSHALDNQYDIFKHYIPSPQWTERITGVATTVKSLIPDTIRQVGSDMFLVDAKYYKDPFNADGSLRKGHPGIGDISKQYLYVDALRKVPALSTYTYHNSFVMPSVEENITNIGEIEFDLFPAPNIQIILFPAKRLFAMYISGTVLTEIEITSEFY